MPKHNLVACHEPWPAAFQSDPGVRTACVTLCVVAAFQAAVLPAGPRYQQGRLLVNLLTASGLVTGFAPVHFTTGTVYDDRCTLVDAEGFLDEGGPAEGVRSILTPRGQELLALCPEQAASMWAALAVLAARLPLADQQRAQLYRELLFTRNTLDRQGAPPDWAAYCAAGRLLARPTPHREACWAILTAALAEAGRAGAAAGEPARLCDPFAPGCGCQAVKFVL